MRRQNTVCVMVKSNLTMFLVWYNIKERDSRLVERRLSLLEFIVQKEAAYRQYAVSFYLKVLLLFR